VNVTKFKIKSRSFLLAPVPAIVHAVCWKIPATKCTEPGPIFIKYGQTSITNGAQLTFLVPLLKAIETRVCGATFTELCVNSTRSVGKIRTWKCRKNQQFKPVCMPHLRNYSKSSDDVLGWVCAKAGSPDLC